ncbi:MAG TPA: peroxiredoxin [Gemmataceae bacterium]|jgi:peroxiredoxin Q/BCP
MTRFPAIVLAVTLTCIVSARADDAPKKTDLKVGDKAPAFEARNDSDATWNSAEHYGKKWIVIYFYPGDFTPGCTAQAKAFAAAMGKLTEKGVDVVGVSGDSVQIHERFKKSQKLNFTLLTDEDGAIAKKFGVPFSKGAKVKARDEEKKLFEFERKGTAARWTFIVGKDGKIAYKNVKVDPLQDAKKVAEFIAEAEDEK